MRPCGVDVAGTGVVVDAPGERGDVADADDPLAEVAGDGFAGEPDLDGAVAERGEGERAVRVSLDADRAGLLALGPLLLAVIGTGLVVAEGGVG